MPKEITHWLLARRLAETARDTPFGPALAAEPDCLLLGAVAHDVFFYLTGDPAPGLRELPYALHGSRGQDPGALILAQAEHAWRSGSYKAQALLAGLVSHACADAVLHPLVFYQTGHLFSPDAAVASRARQNHRALESLWDMHLTGGNLKGVQSWSLKDIAAGTGAPFEALCALPFLARTAQATLEDTARAWDKALDTFVTIQSLARNELVAWTTQALFPVLPTKVREVAALFYCPQYLERLERVRGVQVFRQPVTGEEQRATLAELMDTAVAEAARLLDRLVPMVFASQAMALPGPLPSLETGLPLIPGEAMVHFAAEPIMGL